MEKEYKQLFDAIRLDNLVSFCSLVDENKSYLEVSFGRFPILSVCYLFKAKHIIKKYEKQLLLKSQFIKTTEPVLLQKTFMKNSGRCLRLFLDRDCIVFPIEMLAILGQDRKVKKLYKNINYDTVSQLKIKEIYEIKHQKIWIYKNKIKIYAPKPNKFERQFVMKLAIIPFAFIFLICGGLIGVGVNVGLGTEFSVYKISTEQGLINCLSTKGYYKLTQDIVIDNVSKLDLNCNLDGNNKTISVKSGFNESLIKNNKGSLKNLTIKIICDDEISFNESIGGVCENNYGSIENIDVVMQHSAKLIKNTINSVNICGVCVNNYGSVKNISVDMKIYAVGENQGGDATICGGVGTNEGKIDNVVIKRDSFVTTTDVDIVGICEKNNSSGKIENCKNYGDFVQTDNLNEWSPTIAGVCITNYGEILSSYNLGDIKIVSNVLINNEKIAFSCFAGGIVVNNYNKVSGCLAKSEINVESKQKNAIVGGVAGQSVFEDNGSVVPTISNCGSECKFVVNIDYLEDYQNLTYVGGIMAGNGAGVINGVVNGCVLTNSYSGSSFEIGESNYVKVGLCMGATFVVTSFFETNIFFNEISNIYCLKTDNQEYQFGYGINLYSGQTYSAFNTNGELIKTVLEMKNIIDAGVYIDEI